MTENKSKCGCGHQEHNVNEKDKGCCKPQHEHQCGGDKHDHEGCGCENHK